MYGLVLVIHALVCILLILIVLIQQGRGGGLIDSFSSAESIFGTKTNTFLVKSTSVLAVVFFITCLGLAFLSIQKSKSLFETNYKPLAATPTTQTTSTPAPAAPAAPATEQTSSIPGTATVAAPAAPAVSSPTPAKVETK